MVWGYSGETASEGLSPQQVGGVIVEVAEPLCCHHMVAMLSVLERTVHSLIIIFCTPLWCRTLLGIYRSAFLVTPVGLDHMTKSATTYVGKWARHTMA